MVSVKFLSWVQENQQHDVPKYKNPKYWDRQAWANHENPDQMLLNVASSYQGLYCLPLIQQSLDTSYGRKIDTLQPLYNTVHYNTVDITKDGFKDGSQKCIDYIEK